MTYEEACEYVGLVPIRRQSRKWALGFGIAYRAKLKHVVILEDESDPKARRNLADRQLARAGVFNF